MTFTATMSIEDRFFSHVDTNGPVPVHAPELGPCWIWTGNLDEYGYGRFKVNNKSHQAHRWLLGHRRGRPLAWSPTLREVGAHRCDNRQCVRESHLYIGSQQANVGDSIKTMKHVSTQHRARTHCKNGHEFSPRNTYITKSGCRACRICQAAAQQKYREQLRRKRAGLDMTA